MYVPQVEQGIMSCASAFGNLRDLFSTSFKKNRTTFGRYLKVSRYKAYKIKRNTIHLMAEVQDHQVPFTQTLAVT